MANATPLQPYLLIAYYEWMVDNDWTPQVLVDCSYPDVDVPQQFANDGKIVLNIAPEAVANFELNHDYLSFSARFSGKSLNVYIPMNSIVAVYARENDQGIMFSPNMYGDDDNQEPPQGPDNHDNGDGPDDEPPTPPKGRPNLKVVK
ncbi:ClpXP protease specificity-enhancing factor [Kangiella shandongensis]|uniref:ClpXP protease specificity-enhancing factor n=1 Tax=Kangiella shandongensis TaxID=2763258 RepID=UPI001CBEC16B|nr:ClpXP protease specificity-enhancing factor [Kangiella shandongensis]